MSHIFISYSHTDTEYVHTIASYLRGQQFKVWYDADIRLGDNWQESLSIAIGTCSVVLVVMSEAGHNREWIEREITMAKRLDRPIVPILLDGLPYEDLNLNQYIETSRDATLPDSVLERLQAFVRFNSSYYIEALIPLLESQKAFKEEGTWTNQFSLIPAYLGLFERHWTFDICAVGLIQADGFSSSQLANIHDDFVRYLSKWRPSFFGASLIKKRGLMLLVYENSMSQEQIQTIRALRYDSEANGLELVNGVRTATWAIDLQQLRIQGQSLLLDIFPPATADFYPHRAWLSKIIPQLTDKYLQTKMQFKHMI